MQSQLMTTSIAIVAPDGTPGLVKQVELDIDTLERASGRTYTDHERDEIRGHQQRAYRWTFLVSGLQHPNFVRIVGQLTAGGPNKIAGAVAEPIRANTLPAGSIRGVRPAARISPITPAPPTTGTL